MANANTKIQQQTDTTLLEERLVLTCQASEIDQLQNALNNKIRTVEEAYTLVKNKTIAANTRVLALLMNQKEIKLLKKDLKNWLDSP